MKMVPVVKPGSFFAIDNSRDDPVCRSFILAISLNPFIFVAKDGT